MKDPARLEKQIFVGFAGTITFGLFLSGWYVSSRVLLAGKPPAIVHVELPPPPAPVESAVATEPVPSKPVPFKPAAPKPVVAKPVSATLPPVQVIVKHVEPREGDRFLQLAAMGPHATEDYLKLLAAKGISPLIAPGPSENIERILMGPYANSTELKKAQTALEGQGIQTMVRVY